MGRKEGGCAGQMLLYTVAFLALPGVTLWERGERRKAGRVEESACGWKRARAHALSDKLFRVCVSKHGFRTVSEERERESAHAGQTGRVQRQSPDSARYPKERNLVLSFFLGYNRIG